MMLRPRSLPIVLLVLLLVTLVYYRNSFYTNRDASAIHWQEPTDYKVPAGFDWAKVKANYPVTSYIPMPSSAPQTIPRIQHTSTPPTGAVAEVRKHRLDTVKAEFVHAWTGYKIYAWLQDEVAPLSGGVHNPFGGWAATLVDSLDTLLIMEMTEDFEEALSALDKIDFTTCSLETLNVFETTIRYLGGFLAAYDLSEGKYPSLLDKAKELGEMLYVAFDTPNHFPMTRWHFKDAMMGKKQVAPDTALVAEIGSLTLEFTRLSQITGDPKYFDAVQRIMNVFEQQQDDTKLPGLWPVMINTRDMNFTQDSYFTLGGMADSMYEYLPKQHLLLGGRTDQYKRMYEKALTTMKSHIFYRPMLPNMDDILFPGQVQSDGKLALSALITEPQAQHLGCFVGGMVGIGAKMFSSDTDLTTAKKLVEGCLWAYETAPLGVMPEIFHTVSCAKNELCGWDEHTFDNAVMAAYGGGPGPPKARQIPGITRVDDARYILRPEAIESVFIHYRITGDASLQDRAWNMFESIIKHTKTPIAHAALSDCITLTGREGEEEARKMDKMESFWLAETLKYFYLIFADESLVSLDDWVLNTEAHPLRRPN